MSALPFDISAVFGVGGSAIVNDAAQLIQRMPAIERGITLTVAGCERIERTYADLVNAGNRDDYATLYNAARNRTAAAREALQKFLNVKANIASVLRYANENGKLTNADVRYFLDDTNAPSNSVRSGGSYDAGVYGLGAVPVLVVGAAAAVVIAGIVVAGAAWVAQRQNVLAAENAAKSIDAQNAANAQVYANAMAEWARLAASRTAAGDSQLPPLPQMPEWARQETPKGTGSSVASSISEGVGASVGALLPLLVVAGVGLFIARSRK